MARTNQRVVDLEEGILNSVELLDNCDGSRVNLQNTLDEVRETLVTSYGDSFQEEYDEMLGTEAETDDEEDEEEEE
jgi:bifunctional DNA-binding transcriptional regulator/antitoxin component of YhaV-PrlF toxin-antitoxin module